MPPLTVEAKAKARSESEFSQHTQSIDRVSFESAITWPLEVARQVSKLYEPNSEMASA